MGLSLFNLVSGLTRTPMFLPDCQVILLEVYMKACAGKLLL